jgi:hypothetical protein
MNMKIGFIGQGWIGKNLADHFEERGFETIRFAKEEPYNQNEEALKECDIVFVAVPTPTTPAGLTTVSCGVYFSMRERGRVSLLNQPFYRVPPMRSQKKIPTCSSFMHLNFFGRLQCGRISTNRTVTSSVSRMRILLIKNGSNAQHK